MVVNDTWSETALVAIAAQAGFDVKFASITETIDMDIGDKDIDVIATIAGGRLVKFNPQEPTTVTLEVYPVEAATSGLSTATTGVGVWDLFNTFQTFVATNLISIPNDRNRKKYRIAILWTDSTSITDATAAVSSPANSALRFAAADGFFTSVKPSFTDGLLKFTVVFKVPPFDKNGGGNIVMQSINGTSTSTLTALSSYTSSAKGW